MLLRVSHIRQSGPLSFIVKYVAEVEMTPGDPRVAVEVLSTVPGDAVADDVAVAAESIRRGAESVLRPLGTGAILRLQGLCIHHVDFAPRKFEEITAEELSRALATHARPGRSPNL